MKHIGDIEARQNVLIEYARIRSGNNIIGAAGKHFSECFTYTENHGFVFWYNDSTGSTLAIAEFGKYGVRNHA